MMTPVLSLRKDYWDNFEFQGNDLQFLYNYLIEIETPQTPQELLRALVGERIRLEKITLEKRQNDDGVIYLPKNQYAKGDTLVFPAFEWQKGIVNSIRPGNIPESKPFEVIEVLFENGTKKQFAAGLEEHNLNNEVFIRYDDPILDRDHVLKNYEAKLTTSLVTSLEQNPDFVRIAGRWFPRALLVDINIGYLNLAEALLEENAEPLSTDLILEQIEFPTDSNKKLTEFSIDLALQEDERFDEVGPLGQTAWFLRRMEPQGVQEIPPQLKYQPIQYNPSSSLELQRLFCKQIRVVEEVETISTDLETCGDLIYSLLYPYWRSGTLPLSERLYNIFPTAEEAPRIRFTFVDGKTGQKFPGWVVRQKQYIHGLSDWYNTQGVIPGSLIHLEPGKLPGEIVLWIEKRKANREWIRTAQVGSDGKLGFSMLKQLVSTSYDERMAIFIPDVKAIDTLWENNLRSHTTLEQTINTMLLELAKLNPQGHVHAQELYAALNITRRCPPGPILNILATSPSVIHLGDLYFRMDDKSSSTGRDK